MPDLTSEGPPIRLPQPGPAGPEQNTEQQADMHVDVSERITNPSQLPRVGEVGRQAGNVTTPVLISTSPLRQPTTALERHAHRHVVALSLGNLSFCFRNCSLPPIPIPNPHAPYTHPSMPLGPNPTQANRTTPVPGHLLFSMKS